MASSVPSKEELSDFTAELRHMLAEEARLNPEKYSDIDLRRVNEDDEYCHRFLRHFENRKSALKNSKVVLQWRKSFKVNDIKFSNLDQRFFELGACYPMGMDKDGSKNLFVMFATYKVRDLENFEDFARFVIYWFEYMDKRSDGKQINLVIYVAGCGLANINWGLMRFGLPALTTYYPWLFKHLFVYDVPLVLKAVWKIIKTWMDEKYVNQIKFVNDLDLLKYMDENVVPVFMGGKGTHKYVRPQETD